MADLGSKSALKTSIDAKIYTNTTFQVSAEDIRSSFEDTIDTLCGNVVVVGSYANLAILVNNGSLIAGNIYVFPYETVSRVGSDTNNMLNTASPGYTPIIENLAIVAKNTNSFFGQARSLEYPKDIIVYDYNDNNEPVTVTARSGFIKYRRDVDRNIEAFFDFRNNIVARKGLSTSIHEVTTTASKAKGEVIYYNVASSTVSAGWYFVNITSTDIKTDAEANSDVLSAISQINENMYSQNIYIGTTLLQVDSTTVAYHQSLDSLSKNIIIKQNTTDVLLVNSSDINIGQNVTKTTINASSDAEVGSSCFSVVIKSSTSTIIDSSCSDIFCFLATNNNIGWLSNKYLGISSLSTSVGSNSSRVVSISSSQSNEVGDGCSSIYFLRDASYNVLGKNNANITIFKGSNNSFESSCSSIQIYGGSNNRFAQSCTLINMLGDRDETLGLGAAYTSPYSKMDNNTFGTSCANITFDKVGGRGNTFGDECANLTFTSALDVTWRLVGCDFCRGIRNKTFKRILHGLSFIVPNQATVVITEQDWYVPQLFVGTRRPTSVTDPYYHDGKRATSTGSINNSNSNPIHIGYARIGGFWDQRNVPAGGQDESKAQYASGAENGTANNSTHAEMMLHGISAQPTNKAWQWTNDGYPLLINFIASNDTDGDPTSDIDG